MRFSSDSRELAFALLHAKADKNFTWEYINKVFHDFYAYDRRYKIWFDGSTTNGDGFYKVGKQRYLVYFSTNYKVALVRPVSEYDKYDKKPCFKVKILPKNDSDNKNCFGFVSEWQNETLI